LSNPLLDRFSFLFFQFHLRTVIEDRIHASEQAPFSFGGAYSLFCFVSFSLPFPARLCTGLKTNVLTTFSRLILGGCWHHPTVHCEISLAEEEFCRHKGDEISPPPRWAVYSGMLTFNGSTLLGIQDLFFFPIVSLYPPDVEQVSPKTPLVLPRWTASELPYVGPFPGVYWAWPLCIFCCRPITPCE